jgi:hypothetical protein
MKILGTERGDIVVVSCVCEREVVECANCSFQEASKASV